MLRSSTPTTPLIFRRDGLDTHVRRWFQTDENRWLFTRRLGATH
jgi:hypothetical protein